jgi:long-subunit fatty acid transport protein
MKRLILRGILISMVCWLAVFAAVSPGCAQLQVQLEIPSSPSPVGSGARALGMGGAFIAIADDATAASWNPGGLIQLEKPEISVAGGYVQRTEDNSFGTNPEASGQQSIEDFNLNYLSVAYPFKAANRNMIVSLNYQRLYDFNRNQSYTWDTHDPAYTSSYAFNYEQKGALYALGLAFCMEVTPRFSAGVTLNYWGDFININKWQQTYSRIEHFSFGAYPGVVNAYKTETYAFSGWNANLGFLWKMTEHWTLGGVLKTPFTASIDHGISEDITVQYPTYPAANTHTVKSTNYADELQMPMSYGLGLAYRFSDKFTVSGDLYRTHWNDFIYKNYQGVETSPISGDEKKDARIANTTWFRLGTEYLIIGSKYVVPLRAGIFYDPAPADESPDNYYGFSLGSGIAYDRFIFDIAYQFRFGNGVGATQMRDLNFSKDVREHTIYTSMIIHF